MTQFLMSKKDSYEQNDVSYKIQMEILQLKCFSYLVSL